MVASPEPEQEAEKEAEAVAVELKPETKPDTQTDVHTGDEQTEKSPATATPSATEAVAAPAEPAPAAPEENRVGGCVAAFMNWVKWQTRGSDFFPLSCSRSPGRWSPVRTSLPAGLSLSQESLPMSSKSPPQHR